MDSFPLTRKLVVAAHAGLAGALVGAAALHLGWAKQVDTVRNVFSDYALSDGADQVFAGTVACLSMGSTALVAGLVRSRLPVGAPAIVLLGAWCGGLALAVVFPTDTPGVPTIEGLVHRYAAGGAVAALPAATLLIARRLGRRPGWETTARALRRTSWASVAGCVAFMCAHLCAMTPDPTPLVQEIGSWLGLAERITLALEMGLLFILAGAVAANGEDRLAGAVAASREGR
ncbi:DUF998 domain-containing protein [Nonomuraea sp. NBC_00507]|uniref:DUF998 domain-containing protein n=1 Tax=Nonomuraea sp. NBC_00507 TaxID=2976002 RepID=UPI002E178A7F